MPKGIKTPSGEMVYLKTNFEAGAKLEPFYTGGGVAVSGDGRFLVSSCGSAVKLVDLDTGQTTLSVSEEEDSVASLAVSGDGSLLAVGWRSVLVKLYNLREEAKCVRSWKAHNGPAVAMAFDSSSTLLATGSTDSSLKVWDATRHYCTHNFRGSGGVVTLAVFHPSHLHLVTTSTDNAIRVWSLTTSRCVHALRGHVSAVTGLSFSVGGDLLISGGRDQVVLVWAVDSGSLLHTIPVYETVEGVAVLPADAVQSLPRLRKSKRRSVAEGVAGGVVFATAGDKGVIRIWSSLTSDPIHTLHPLPQGVSECSDSGAPQSYSSLLYSHGCLLGVTFDHSVLVYDSKNQFSQSKQLIGYLDEVLDLSYVGEDHVAIATNSEQVKVFHTKSGSYQLLTGHAQIVLCLSVCGETLVTGSRDNSIRVWRMEGGAFHCVAIGTGHTHYIGAVALSRLKSSFAVSGSQDCTIKLWNLKTLRGVGVAGAEPTHLTVKYTQLAHDKDINSVDVSPNDRLIVSGSQDKTAKLWAVRSGELMGTFRGHRRGVWSVRFSPVDQCVATASGDGTLKLWAISDFSCVKTFEGHTSSVLKVVFLSRGMQLASSGGDGLVKVWTIRSGECVTTLDGHTDRVWALTASPDGGGMVSGGGDSLVSFWKDVTEVVESAEMEKHEELLLRQQELENLLQQKDYVRAVGMAICLDQPFRLLSVLQELLDEGMGEGSKFTATILSLRKDQQADLVRYSTCWNQNAKHCHIAQSVLAVLLGNLDPEVLLTFDGVADHVRSLIPYTERHLQRLDRLEELSMFVEYSCQKMSLSLTEEASVTEDKEAEFGGVEHTLAIADTTTPGMEYETTPTSTCGDVETTPTSACGAVETTPTSLCEDVETVSSTVTKSTKVKMSRRKTKLKRLVMFRRTK